MPDDFDVKIKFFATGMPHTMSEVSSFLEVCMKDVLSGFRVPSNILKSKASAPIDFTIRFAKKLMVEPSATVGLGLRRQRVPRGTSSKLR